MGLLRNLEIMLGTIVSRKVDSGLFNWIEAVSQVLDGEGGPAGGVTAGAMFGISQATWFVDPINGNDANNGATQATALKTDARRQVLWGGSSTALLTQPTTVTYLSSPPATDIVNYNVAYGTGASLTILGTKTVTNPAITLTAVTTLNRATQTPWDVTGVGLGAADVGRLMRITAGARTGNYCGVAKDLTGGKVRISPMGTTDFALIASTGVAYTQVTPIAGDIVEVFTVPTLTIGSCIFRALSNTVPTQTTNCVVFDTIQLDGGASWGASSILGSIILQGAQCMTRQSIMGRCKVSGVGGFWGGGGIFNNNFQVQGGFSNNGGPFCQILSFLMTTGAFTVQAGAACTLGGDCLFQNAGLVVGGNLSGEFISVFDRSVSNTAVQVFMGGAYRSVGILSTDLLWGDANTGVGCRIRSGGSMTYVTKPTINTPQGAGRQSLVGGVNLDWAAIPAVTAANNAMIVVEA
jgi:hypothetical protein